MMAPNLQLGVPNLNYVWCAESYTSVAEEGCVRDGNTNKFSFC